MIKLENISLNIPVYTDENRQFKRVILRSATGGLLKQIPQNHLYKSIYQI